MTEHGMHPPVAPDDRRDLYDGSPAGLSAVVTGGGSGIGARLVNGMVQRRARVIAVDRAKDALEGAVKTWRSSSGEVQGVVVDVAEEGTTDELGRQAIADHGRLAIWVKNTGVFDARPALAASSSQWDQTQAVNVRGVFLDCRAAGTHMCEQRFGAIVNVASIRAMSVRPLIGFYPGSKAALEQLTRALAAE